ncbi:substrate-binding domain-containing protein [Amycolatopsis thermophila]|uniref:Ribose transport system substrate-binding protein n=1 Tax=Amycolatopsis thermophila TaxID=206084 RepID=A0ABU0F4Y2_9PSEU|nr:substrate-binding domain-containing protein [Amycolatopsis thermophila]MDQ0382221.1 ribose transport system substrate-binding protein [Amycolatopsis thermophila]
MRKSRSLAAVGACLLLAACGTTHENSGTQSAQGAPAKCGADGKYTIGMSQANVAEPYRQRMDDDIRAAAAAVPQFTVNFADAAQDNSKQVEQVDNFLTQQIDLLIISPNEATPLTAPVKRAYDKGIPVLVLDRKVDGDAYTSFIGADNVDIGRQAGEYFKTVLLPRGGKIGELRGLAGSTPARERHDGFMQGIQGSNIQIVAAQDGDWLRDKGQQQADAILKANPDIQAIYSHNDPMGEGARIAAVNAGRPDLPITGIDGLPIESGGLKAVEAGRLSATFLYPTGGKEAIDAAKRILVDCQQVPKTQTLPTKLVTKENAAATYAELNGS